MSNCVHEMNKQTLYTGASNLSSANQQQKNSLTSKKFTQEILENYQKIILKRFR